MSSDSADASAPSPLDQLSGFGRSEAVQTTTHRLPEGERHGAAGSFVLADCYRDAEIVQYPERERLPDGSLYQSARAARLAAAEDHGPDLVEDSDGRERVVLSRDYALDGERHAVVMTDSRWRAGTGEGDDYTPWYKYDLTLRPIDEDDEIAWKRTRSTSLNVKIQPQRDGLVDSDGKDLSIPYGEGTLVSVQSTWVDDPEELFERTRDLVDDALGYEADREDVVPESTTIWKAEVHHRFAEDAETDLVHTIRQSADLLAHHEAGIETKGIHDEHRWLECRLTSAAWEKLGFQRLGKPIQIKVYYPDNPDAVASPMDQPKVEVALQGGGRGDHLGWEQWDAIQDAIQEILLSHLTWAGIGADQLVADDYSDGAQNPEREWQHPEGRRTWLANHYERLMPALYREAQRENTDLIYDILDVVRRHQTVTYQTLMDETGGSYRSIRRHVTRLAAMGGDDPGILAKIQDAETWVAFSSRALDEDVDDALEECGPSSSPDDRQQRAEERRERRQERRERRQGPAVTQDDADSHGDESGRERDRSDDHGTDPSLDAVEDDQEDATASTRWRYFGDVGLTPEQLATALDREHIDAGHVRIRTDPYGWLPPD